MLLEEKILVKRGVQPLMMLRKYQLSQPLGTAQAKDELENFIATQSDGKSHTWGYFPELKPNKNEYSNSIKLANEVEKQVLLPNNLLMPMNLELAFVRLATSEPQSSYGGMHIDVSRGIGHEWPPEIDWRTHHVMRCLFNVGEYPRKLEFADITIDEYKKKYGKEVPRDRYKQLDISDDVPLLSAEIPPMENDAVYCIQFISTLIPHAGRTGGPGHFLVCYGGYVEAQKISTIFHQ